MDSAYKRACTSHTIRKFMGEQWGWRGKTHAPAARTAADAAAEAAAARDISPMALGLRLGLGLGLGLGSAVGMTGVGALGGGDVNATGTGLMGAGGSGLSGAGDGVGAGSSTVRRRGYFMQDNECGLSWRHSTKLWHGPAHGIERWVLAQA